MNQVCKDLGGFLTANDLRIVQDHLNNALSIYDVEESEDHALDDDTFEFLKAYISAKEIEGKSKNTVERYQYILSRMIKDVNIPVRSITVFHIRNYLTQQKARGLSDCTLEGIRSVISSYFGWLTKEGLIQTDPCANIAPIKCQKKVRTPYSDTDLERLKSACKSDRDLAILYFALATGCRISEICSLNRDSIDFAKHECKVLGKGNKERVVFIDNVTTMYLQRYFMNRNDRSEALFAGKGTDRMTPGGVRIMLKRLSEKAGVENVHPHRFRRTLATNLINHGMAIQEVASILGHDKIDTTMTYIYMDKDNIKNAYYKYI